MAGLDKIGTYPGETTKAYPEKYDIRAMPPQPKVLKPGQLPEKVIRQFFDEVNRFRVLKLRLFKVSNYVDKRL